MIRLIAFLLLIPSLAFAQDQSLAPDGEHGPSAVFSNITAAACSTGTACAAAACETEVDESPDSGDNLYLCTETTNAVIRFTFPTPSSDPDTGTNAQAIDLIMSCTDADTDNSQSCLGSPTFSLELWCGGSATGVSPFNGVSIAVDSDHSATFTYPGACATDGSDLEFHFILGRSGGSPGDRRWAAIEAVEWEVTHAAGGGSPARRRMWVIQ